MLNSSRVSVRESESGLVYSASFFIRLLQSVIFTLPLDVSLLWGHSRFLSLSFYLHVFGSLTFYQRIRFFEHCSFLYLDSTSFVSVWALKSCQSPNIVYDEMHRSFTFKTLDTQNVSSHSATLYFLSVGWIVSVPTSMENCRALIVGTQCLVRFLVHCHTGSKTC